jgi:hypothetical protein
MLDRWTQSKTQQLHQQQQQTSDTVYLPTTTSQVDDPSILVATDSFNI